jgi:hypothetical protein
MATSRPRLSSTTPMPRLASSKMLILASSNAAMWGRRLRTDRNASHRGARGIAPETEPETNRYARVHSQNRLSGGHYDDQLVPVSRHPCCPECGVPYDQAESDHQLEDRQE